MPHISNRRSGNKRSKIPETFFFKRTLIIMIHTNIQHAQINIKFESRSGMFDLRKIGNGISNEGCAECQTQYKNISRSDANKRALSH